MKTLIATSGDACLYVEDNVISLYLEDNFVMYNKDNAKKIYEAQSKKLYGDVLLVGLGLSILLKYVENNPDVTSVLVVEKSQDIININKVLYNYSPKVKIICGDIYNIDLGNQKFDSLHIDISDTPDPNYEIVIPQIVN